MTEVAAEAGETFAWTTNIPEVILTADSTSLLATPYEGQSKQDYIKALSHHYDEKYEFYKTIPGCVMIYTRSSSYERGNLPTMTGSYLISLVYFHHVEFEADDAADTSIKPTS